MRGKLDMEVESIDDVIMLLDYIDSLRRQDNKIADISRMIDELAVRMDYIESVCIMFPDEQYAEFLSIRNWPRTFMQYIDERKAELLAQKDELYREMGREIEEVFDKVKEFRETIAEALAQGLVEKELSYDAEDDMSQDSDASGPAPVDPAEEEAKRLEQQRQLESADGKTFAWLAKEIAMDHMKFDPAAIEQVYLKIDHLKQCYDDVERATALINRRETLLGVTKTQFQDLRALQDDLKPLHELWRVAYRFARTIPQWVEGRFDALDAAQVEARVEEWSNELKRLQKTHLVTENPKQQELQKFMADALGHFKRYGPMLRTLRTKGLAARHWRMIGEKLEFVIDPARITMYRLAMLELDDEEKLKTTKQICEIATKEYSLQVALEALEQEMAAVAFEFQVQPDGETVAVTRLPELTTLFEELYLRAGVLKTNPHIRNFLEKLLELEKTLKSVVDLIGEWADFQRNFIYLNGVFQLDEITQALPAEAKFFLQVQALYTTATQAFQAAPQAYRISQRENFLATLVKSNQECDAIRAGLAGLLERRRGKCPRLFFLSNEEVIELFGHGTDLAEALVEGEASAGFITSLFEGIEAVSFHEVTYAITAMHSKDGEEVPLAKEVVTRSLAVDSWLGGLEAAMVLTVKDYVWRAFAEMGTVAGEEWATAWPGQATFLCSQLWFTRRVRAIFAGSAEGSSGRYGNARPEDEGEKPEGDAEKAAADSLPATETAAGSATTAPNAAPGSGNPTENAELAEDRAYEEEVMRQIAKDEEFCPERAQLEKVLRLKRRFRVSKSAPAEAQMQRLQQEIAETIMLYTGMVRRRLKSHVRHSTVALLTGFVHFRDILTTLLREKVCREDEFFWQMQLKFDMLNMLDVVYKAAHDSAGRGRLETNKLEVDCEVFGHHRSYGFEYLGNCPRLVVTPLTERCQRSLLVALQYHYGGAPEGPFGTGKTETTKDLGRQLGKLSFVLNCSANYEYAGVCRFFKGLASSGAWVCFDEFNRMEPRLLSLISQVIISIQGAIRTQAPHLQLDEAKIPLDPDCAIFVTLNPGYAGRTELPSNLRALFRAVSMVVPDSVFITEILLYSSGFVGAQQLAKKIVSVQNLADVIMQNTEIAHDFGLRSIKAIVGIAENLKLQAQNIVDSELAEVIDDRSLSQAPYKADQVLKEVMTATEAAIAKAAAGLDADHSDEPGQSPRSPARARGRAAGLTPAGGGSAIPADASSPALRGNGLGGTTRDIEQRHELDGKDDQADVRAEGAELRESLESLPAEERVAPEGKEGGELYDRLWEHAPYTERQLRTVYKQIGIDPDQQYEEAVLEEYIILKAVRDFNHSKFATEEHLLIEGVIKDVFQGAVPDLDKPVQDYGNLKEALKQSFEDRKLDFSPSLQAKALQFYEIQRTKHGCILAGEPQSGKSTLVSLVQCALNKAAMNELMLTVSEKRRQRLVELAKGYQAEILEAALSRTHTSGKSGTQQDMMGGVKKKNKKQDKEAEAKKLQEKWHEMYRQTGLTEEELNAVRAKLTTKGVQMRRMNPKGMALDELFGAFDEESHEWREGLFTQQYREYAGHKDDKKKWILLDGPIDFSWVEHLNSVLDDNKKLSLANGEAIKMSDGMCILLETDHLRNATPATVSRCGLVYLHREETCDPKAIFNQWLRKLPPNLAEYAADLECIANFLMVEAVEVFEAEAEAGALSYAGADMHWVMQNFVRLLTTLVYDFFIEYERGSALNPAAKSPDELGASLLNMSLGNGWVDAVSDPNMTVYTPSEPPRSAQEQSRQGSRHLEQRVKTPDARQRELEKRKRLPRCNFIDSEMRLESGLKYTPIWLEAFLIFALVWTFHPVLSRAGRKQLDARLQAKYDLARTDFSAYQKEKKRKLAEKTKLEKGPKQHGEKNKSTGRASALSAQKASVSAGSASGAAASQRSASRLGTAQPAGDGFTLVWTDDLPEKPLLISEFPPNASFYDHFFNLDSSQWNAFSLELALTEAQIDFGARASSQKRAQNFYVPSRDSLRYQYVLECLITNQVSTVVVGPACSGRSALLKNTLFGVVFDFTKQLVTDHVTMSSHCDATRFKENIERLLEWRPSKLTGERKLRPHLESKLICYVEDLHLGWTDQHGDQPAVEAIRDYLTDKAWLSSRKRRWREIEDVTIFACMAANAPETARVSRRVLHRFNLVTLDEPDTETVHARLKTYAEQVAVAWPSSIQLYASSISGALVDLCRRVFEHLKPTPMKAHYAFCWRDAGKVLMGMQMIEPNSLKRQVDVMKLFYHECFRNFGDRLLMAHDRRWFTQALEEVCRKHFFVVDQLEAFALALAGRSKADPGAQAQDAGSSPTHAQSSGGEEIDPRRKDQFLWPIRDPEQLFYSRWNQEVEGFYMEVENLDEIGKIIAANLDRYNDSNERARVDLILFNKLNREMLKILRVLSAPNGHLVNVAMKGFGMSSVLKLATFAAGHQLRELDVCEGLTAEEWHDELKRAVLACGEEGKQVTLYVDEYKMLRPEMYQDLECLLKNFVASEVVGKPDIQAALVALYQQLEAERKTDQVEADTYADDDLTPEQRAEKARQKSEQQAEFLADSRQMLLRWPHIQAGLYDTFLNRVRDNFHLVLQYSPTGQNFREKITAHKQLLYLSSVVFVTDLPAPELEALGQGFFKLEHEKAVLKSQVDGTGVPKVKQYSTTNDTDSKTRVLRCIGKMFLQAQEMTRAYAEDEEQVLYMAPAMYLRVFTCYRKLLKERQAVVREISSRYEAGLAKIKQTQDAIYTYYQELEERSPVLQEKHDAVGRVMAEIEEEFARVTSQREQLKRDEFEAAEQAEQALKIKEECEETLNKIVPSLNEAMNSVEAPSKLAIAELRALQKPPKVVKLVMQAVCMLLGVPPAEKKSRKTGKLKLSYWQAAQGKAVLGNPRLPELLVEFDRNKLTPEIMMEVEEVLTQGGYSYEKAHTACAAATGIFKWVKATREYFYIFKEIEPRRDAFMQSQKQYEEKKKQLQDKADQIALLDSALQELKGHLRAKDEVLSGLRAEIQDCNQRKKRADVLLRGLSAEKQKWVVCTRMLAAKYTTVTGDVLLSAGYITLLSGFSQRYRHRLLAKWAKALTEEGFQCSEEFVFTELFGDSYQIRTWHLHQLPHDQVSINNALVIEKTKRFCLLVDPQMQGVSWLKHQNEAAGTLTATTQADPQFRKLVEIAIEMGRTVIVEQVGETIGASLQSLMKKQAAKHGAQPMLQFCRKSYKLDPAFRLFVVTTHARPHFDANATNHVTVLNFNVNLECLQAQMLGLVVSNERRDLDDAYGENSKEAFESIKSLKDVEKSILSLLEQSVDELLGGESLIRTLSESKNTAEYVAARLRNIAQTSAFIQKSRDAYAPVAYRAAVLFFVVQDLAKINCMYSFSLSWFNEVFVRSMELTNVLRGDQRGRGEGEQDGADKDGKPSGPRMTVDERIEMLTSTLTQEIYKRVRMAVFEHDRNLVTYMFAVRVLQAENFIDPGLCEFLLRGAQRLSPDTRVPDGITELPWLDNLMWADLRTLAGLQPFSAANLLGHIAQHQQAWAKFHARLERPLTFQDLPNRDAIDLRYFTKLDDGELAATGDPRPQTSGDARSHGRGTDAASMAAHTAGDSNSRLGSRRQGRRMQRSESEILNDPEIWDVTGSDDEFQPTHTQSD